MKRIFLKFTYHSDLIEVPDKVAQDIQKIRLKFDKWLYDKSNNHSYWVYVKGQKKAVSFDTKAFVDFLNNVYLQDSKEKVRIVQEKTKEISSDTPTLLF